MGGVILDKVNIGYDSAAAAYFSALESGTAMSRCECMGMPHITSAQFGSDKHSSEVLKNSTTGLSMSEQLRASVIASVVMEKGIRAMDMAPLPTYIYGEGILGNPIPLNLQTTMSSSSSSTSSSSGPTSTSSHAPPVSKKAYGAHFKAPKP